MFVLYRAKRFQHLSSHKSTSNYAEALKSIKSSGKSSDKSSHIDDDDALASLKEVGAKYHASLPSKTYKVSTVDEEVYSSINSRVQSAGSISVSQCATPAMHKNGKEHFNYGDLGDEENLDVSIMSMDQFESMMDTLTLQPKHNRLEDDSDTSFQSNGHVSHRDLSPRQVDPECHNTFSRIVITECSEIGNRDTQEDRCVVVTDLSTVFTYRKLNSTLIEQLRQMSFVSIFDGHSGSGSSEFLYQRAITTLFSDPNFFQDTEKTLLIGFKTLEELLLKKLSEDDDLSGSTAICGLYNGVTRTLTLAYVGDSMCVMSSNKKAIELTTMHRVNNSNEKQRIDAAGGIIINHRVNGVLAVTRAFGDSQFKSSRKDQPSKVVIAVPEVHTSKVTETSDFAIFASDGLWDVMSPQAAVNFVWNHLSKKEDLSIIPSLLIKKAICKGSVDNVTVVILWFNISISA